MSCWRNSWGPTIKTKRLSVSHLPKITRLSVPIFILQLYTHTHTHTHKRKKEKAEVGEEIGDLEK
jgi:hypothetical protein